MPFTSPFGNIAELNFNPSSAQLPQNQKPLAQPSQSQNHGPKPMAMPEPVLVSFMLHFLKFLYFLFKSLFMALMHTLINVHLMGPYIYHFAPSGYIMPFYFGFHFVNLLNIKLLFLYIYPLSILLHLLGLHIPNKNL